MWLFSFSGDDCSEIGRTAFFMDDFYHSIMWFQRALEKYDDLAASGQNMSQKITKTLDFLNFGLYKVRHTCDGGTIIHVMEIPSYM